MKSAETVHAFGDDVLGDLDALGVAQLVRFGEVKPEEVAEAAIARAETVVQSVNGVAAERYRKAVVDSRVGMGGTSGTFAGVPTFIKDMIDLEGLPTRFGSEAFATAKPAKKSDPLVRQMIDMGMVCLGKSTMPEMGFTPSTEFRDAEPTRNPWNVRHTAGGSSGGSASLVAAGVVPIAHAADGGGSIRIPAGCCGLVGLKPTHGRLVKSSMTRVQAVPIVSDGVVTRSVRDTAAYFAAAESRYRNRRLKPVGQVDRPLERPLRIAAVTESPGPGVLDGATRREFDATVDLLHSLGHAVTPFELPVDDRLAEDFTLYWSLLAFGTYYAGKIAVHPAFEREGCTDLTRGLAQHFRRECKKAPGAILRLRRSRDRYSSIFDRFDVILSPTAGQLSPVLGHLGMDLPYETLFPRMEQWVLFSPMANAMGTPSISLPLGHDDETNLPVGMMFSGAYGDERLLLQLALQLEAAQPWRRINNPR